MNPPTGYVEYNIDPTLSNVSLNGLVFDPNFIPGFKIGLPNVSIYFSSGQGYADIGYSVGPWNRTYYEVPHLAVGPQNSNFQEIPRTQQFRMPGWGDYYAVKAAFLPPAVNIANYNASFLLTEPIDVGLRTDWNWNVQFSMNWSEPSMLNASNEWAAIGLVTTEYVPSAPTKLVYTVVDFWMDQNSSTFGTNGSSVAPSGNYSIVRVSPNSVTYHPIQLSTSGNVTMNINLTRYTDETLRLLGYEGGAGEAQAPVLSYTFLSVEGYNFRWNGTLYSFFDESNSGTGVAFTQYNYVTWSLLAVAFALAATFSVAYYRIRRRGSASSILSR